MHVKLLLNLEQEQESDQIQVQVDIQAQQSKCQRSSSDRTISTSVKLDRYQKINVTNIQTVMQKTLRQKNISFCSSEQKLALKAVLNNQTLLMIILLMSEDKSLLFMTSACLKDVKVMIMITLF